MKSERLVDFGVIISTVEVKEDQASCALRELSVACWYEHQVKARDILVNGAEQEDFGLGHDEAAMVMQEDGQQL